VLRPRNRRLVVERCRWIDRYLKPTPTGRDGREAVSRRSPRTTVVAGALGTCSCSLPRTRPLFLFGTCLPWRSVYVPRAYVDRLLSLARDRTAWDRCARGRVVRWWAVVRFIARWLWMNLRRDLRDLPALCGRVLLWSSNWLPGDRAWTAVSNARTLLLHYCGFCQVCCPPPSGNSALDRSRPSRRGRNFALVGVAVPRTISTGRRSLSVAVA